MGSNKIYVAIGKEVKERESTLRWALKTFIRKTICVIYVHVPAIKIPLPNGLILPERFITKMELEAFRAQERKEMLRLFDDCSKMCAVFQVPCERTYVEKDSITEGILELIHQLKIENLVMGGAANNKHWRGMMELMSEKVKTMLQSAPNSCHIWSIWNEHLIYKRQGMMHPSPNVEEMRSNSLELKNQSDSGIFRSTVENILGDSDELTKTYPSSTLSDSQFSSAETRVPIVEWPISEEHVVKLSNVPQSFDEHLGSSSPSEINTDRSLYNKPNREQPISEAEVSRREAFRRSVTCWYAEKRALEAIRKAPVKRMNSEGPRVKKAMEEESENLREISAKVSVELSKALDQKLLLESQVDVLNLKVKGLEKNIFSEMELSEKYKNERDKLQIERDKALQKAQGLRKQLTQGPSSSTDSIFSEFSYLELQKATNDFDPSLKIGEGGYGSMYKGSLHHTPVAVKQLNSNSVQNQREFDEQVSCISKLRHPNLVTFMGACREPWCLVYEYLPGGTLKDRLIRQNDNTPPLPWQARIRIAIDICSALIFLHSSQPTCIAQSNLTDTKLLLDANFTCKLTDFGVVSSTDTVTRLFNPEPYKCKPASLKSDVYSFGIIMLQLLTGKQGAMRIVKDVKYASKTGGFDKLLDPLAGDWPFLQAEQLAHMALRCCYIYSNDRPDLASDVWRILSPMRASCSSLSLPSVASPDQPPHYFICPILQETMEDPHFAADGFTYEAEAIRGWLDSGRDTSPMTNLKLANRNLIPNRALRSAIQEWLQSSSTN